MTYDPGYGGQPGGQQFQFYDNPVPDVTQPFGGYGPPSSPAQPTSPGYGTGYGSPAQVSPPAYPGGGNVGRAADRGPRPSTVTIAVGLVFVGVGLAFIGTVLSHLFWTEAFHKLSGESSEIAETTKTVAGVMTFVGAGVNLIAAAGASICAILALRGSNGARITLCVLAGVFAGWKLMCGGYSLITSINGDSAKELRDKVGDAMYLLYAAVGIDVVLMVLAIGIIALLLVGVSNRFFNPARVPRY